MNVNDYVGKPYRVGGRGPDAFDCFGIVAEVFRVERGITLPDWYQEAPGVLGASRAIAAALNGEVAAGRAVATEQPDELNIAIVMGVVRAHHMGVVVDGGVLHAAERVGVVWQPVPRFLRVYPQAEFYKWLT